MSPYPSDIARPTIRVGMIGLGMIFEETYAPFFRDSLRKSLFSNMTGPIDVRLSAVATRTGRKADRVIAEFGSVNHRIDSFCGEDAVEQMLAANRIDAVCIASPDDRHYAPARAALQAGKHVLIEKPAVLELPLLDELCRLAHRNEALGKVVYHKLLDPDHKRLRTLVHAGVLRHVNNGYCSLLEPKSISTSQFAEWIVGRNPATYVAVHYLKLIDFTFGPGWSLKRITANGQRGIVRSITENTWDSVLLQMVYEHPDRREAAFDIHTSWVTPDNFPGYVEQEVQFRFDNAVWNAHQRKRGVEIAVEGLTPYQLKNTPNHHYNGSFLEPWGEQSQRGYGIETISRFFSEVAFVEYGGPATSRRERLQQMRLLEYNDISADRNVTATVQALEAILALQAVGKSGALVEVNSPHGGLILWEPGSQEPKILYAPTV